MAYWGLVWEKPVPIPEKNKLQITCRYKLQFSHFGAYFYFFGTIFTARQHSSSYAKRCISYDRFCLTV